MIVTLIFWFPFDKDANISLLKYADIIYQLEALLKRKVDLVEEGTLLSFA